MPGAIALPGQPTNVQKLSKKDELRPVQMRGGLYRQQEATVLSFIFPHLLP